jgi:predicted regulator of Ras-like GTPase activity (Roadblock/LC7/MglB family)
VEAGVPVAAELAAGVKETALAAMAGSLFTRTADATRTSGFGGVRILQLDAGDGHVVVAGAGPLLVVALTEPAAQLGLVRVEAGRAAEELSE